MAATAAVRTPARRQRHRNVKDTRTQSEKDRALWILFFKLLVVGLSFVIDFGTNLFYTSHASGVTFASIMAAALLMVSDTIAVYFALVLRNQVVKKQYMAASRTLVMVIVSALAVIVDFWATVEPVRMSLGPTTALSWNIATLIGVFVALLTSYLQTEYLPTGIIIARLRLPQDE